ncbi:DoxX family membrane protein [Ekhidna sp. To15]|uniref:DoxX family membrane protein n=1 Tax=Ekhidna sp. To15 TaxID=3395267 RepID=UPI003F526925
MKTILLSAPILCLAFLAILFLQSGLDKVFNYKGNKEWLTGHFAKSPLKNTVGLMMPLITLLEVSAGVLCAVGAVMIVVDGSATIGLLGAQLSTLSILALFFGQRIAQDYAGAATLTTYFIISIMTIYLLWGMVPTGY